MTTEAKSQDQHNLELRTIKAQIEQLDDEQLKTLSWLPMDDSLPQGPQKSGNPPLGHQGYATVSETTMKIHGVFKFYDTAEEKSHRVAGGAIIMTAIEAVKRGYSPSVTLRKRISKRNFDFLKV